MKRQTKIRGIARYIPLPWDGSSLTASILMILSLILLAISVAKPSLTTGVRGTITDLFNPAVSSFSIPLQSLTLILHDVTSFAQIQADKARLEQENEKLRQWYQTALLLESENQSLRSLLNLEIDPKFNQVSARIISDSGSAFIKTILIKAGKNKNIHKDSAVISGQGLIGRIVEVSKTTSRVLLVTDINSRVPVFLEGSDQNLIMAGTNDIEPKLIHLPQDSKIPVGTILFTSGYGGVYPSGLPVGRVKEKENGTLGVMLFSNVNSLRIVRVIEKRNKEQ